MSRIFCEPVKKDDRIFFKDDSKYILFDTGFFGSPGCNSAASDGTIGPYATLCLSIFSMALSI